MTVRVRVGTAKGALGSEGSVVTPGLLAVRGGGGVSEVFAFD